MKPKAQGFRIFGGFQLPIHCTKKFDQRGLGLDLVGSPKVRGFANLAGHSTGSTNSKTHTKKVDTIPRTLFVLPADG